MNYILGRREIIYVVGNAPCHTVYQTLISLEMLKKNNISTWSYRSD